MDGFAFYESYDDDTPKSYFEISTSPSCTVDVPKFETIIYIMKHFPHIITNIPEEEILDRAASSSLSKALLIVQVAWFCTNCASRLFQRLPLSLLEVSTAAHAFCTLLTYFVWWSKPLNVATPTLLREEKAREVYALLKCSDIEREQALQMARERAGGSLMPTRPHDSKKIILAARALQHLPTLMHSIDFPAYFKKRDWMLVPGIFRFESFSKNVSIPITIAICPMLYGLAHFLAWSDRFPTPLERQLWRASSFVVTCSGLVEVFLKLYGESPQSNIGRWITTHKRGHTVANIIFWVGAFVFVLIVPLTHVLASGFLIVESVRQLFFLDDAAYQLPVWSNYWPHFS